MHKIKINPFEGTIELVGNKKKGITLKIGFENSCEKCVLDRSKLCDTNNIKGLRYPESPILCNAIKEELKLDGVIMFTKYDKHKN